MDLYSMLGKGSANQEFQDIVKRYVPAYVLEALGNIAVVLLIAGIVIGIFECYFGYRIRKIWAAVAGMLVFFGIGSIVAMESGLPRGAVIGIGLGAAILGALLGYFLWVVWIFLSVFLSTFSVVLIWCLAAGLDTLSIILALASGLILAILAVVLLKPVLIFYTAVTGGYCLAANLCRLLEIKEWYVLAGIIVILAISGIVVQFLTNRKAVSVPTQPEQMPPFGDMMINEAAPETAAAMEKPEESPVEIMTDNAMSETQDMAAEFGDTSAAVTGAQDALQQNKCPECGAEYQIGTKFCMKCGTKLQ